MKASEIRKMLNESRATDQLALRASEIVAAAENAEKQLAAIAQSKAALERGIEELQTKQQEIETRYLGMKSKYQSEMDALEKMKIDVRDALNELRRQRDELVVEVESLRAETLEHFKARNLAAEVERLSAEIDAKRSLINREEKRLSQAKKDLRVFLAELEQASPS